MYSLHIICSPEDVDFLSADLWEFGTAGIREVDQGSQVELIAGFESNRQRAELLAHFAAHQPDWEQEETTDWVAHTREVWPGREVGERLFLAAPWCEDPTPEGRLRVVHNPGLACGTGEHPCTQMALMAIEEAVWPEMCVVDVGTGSGILSIAALLLGADAAIGLDTDEQALHAAKENFHLNDMEPLLVVGSADAVQTGFADVTVANISGTVLLSIFDDLRRVTHRGGYLILTGFTEAEMPVFQKLLPKAKVLTINEWRCLAGPVGR